MGAFAFTSVNPRLMQTILRHMDALQRSIEGDELYALIARILRKHSRQGPLDTACFTELYHQLSVYASDPVALSTTRIKAKLLQQHIAPYLPEENQATPAEPTVRNTPPPEATDIPFHTIPRAQPATPDDNKRMEPETAKEGTLDTATPPTENGHTRYETLRRSEQDAWRAIYDTVKDFSTLKKLWTSRLEELAQERDRLERKLAETEQCLKTVEANHEKLRAKPEPAVRAPTRKPARRLTKAPRAPATRLVTREMFVQQVQAEISRVKRSGNSAALALLGIDDLRAIEQQHGTGADAAVLNCYAREILSSFRAYDIVGHYGENAFAVLFPDTQQDGAVRALEKAQKRATETHVRRDGRRFPLPGFCGALTVYSPDEEPSLWLQRAEQALATARQQDGQRLVVA